MTRNIAFIIIITFFLLFQGTAKGQSSNKAGEDGEVFSLTPYKIKVLTFNGLTGGLSEPIFFRAGDKEILLRRCKALVGGFWSIDLENGDRPMLETFQSVCQDNSQPLPTDWGHVDKVFGVVFESSPQTSGAASFRIRELDIATRFAGLEKRYDMDSPEKTVDVLIRALFEQFSPIARLEKSGAHSATFQVRGAERRLPTHVFFGNRDDSRGRHDKGNERTFLGGIPVPDGVLLPFVRSLDRDGNPIAVVPVEWTAVLTEEIDPVSRLLRCRVESPFRNVLGLRRRGRTEIYALSIPTPMAPTTIRLEPRVDNTLKTLPPYEVFETIFGRDKAEKIGQTRSDGSFSLPPHRDRTVRICQFRSGRSIIAQISVVRGLHTKLIVPVPDDPVRLEAEGFVIGLQEEIIDVKARKEILDKRLEKFENDHNETMIRETRGELSKLKDDARFLIELAQGRLRYRSEDPIVQRRIDKLFRDTEQTVKKHAAESRKRSRNRLETSTSPNSPTVEEPESVP